MLQFRKSLAQAAQTLLEDRSMFGFSQPQRLYLVDTKAQFTLVYTNTSNVSSLEMLGCVGGLPDGYVGLGLLDEGLALPVPNVHAPTTVEHDSADAVPFQSMSVVCPLLGTPSVLFRHTDVPHNFSPTMDVQAVVGMAGALNATKRDGVASTQSWLCSAGPPPELDQLAAALVVPSVRAAAVRWAHQHQVLPSLLDRVASLCETFHTSSMPLVVGLGALALEVCLVLEDFKKVVQLATAALAAACTVSVPLRSRVLNAVQSEYVLSNSAGGTDQVALSRLVPSVLVPVRVRYLSSLGL